MLITRESAIFEKCFISMKFKKAIFKFTQNIPEREISGAQVTN